MPAYGVFEHMDVAGLDLALRVMEYVAPDLYNEPRAPEYFRELGAGGPFGREDGTRLLRVDAGPRGCGTRAARRVSGGSPALPQGSGLKYRGDSSDETVGTYRSMISIIGIVIVLGAIAAGYTMEHGNFQGAAAARGTGDHFRRRGGNRGDRESTADPDTDRQRAGRRFQRKQVHQGALSGVAQDAVRIIRAVPKSRNGEAGGGSRQPVQGSGVHKVSEIRQVSSRAAFSVRHAAHGGFRRRGPDGNRHDDGGGSRSSSQGDGQADRRVEHDGGCVARIGNCGGGARGGADHGSVGRAQGSDRREGGGGPGGHLFGDSAVLRNLWTAGFGDGEEYGSGVGLHGLSTHGVARLHQGPEPDHGGGTGAALDSGRRASDLSGNGRRLSRWRARSPPRRHNR